MNAVVPSGQTASASSHSNYRGATALAAELTKMLQLVAPSSMTAEDRAAWTLAAVDALEDIRPEEVHACSAEIRRAVTRHNQIVPAIAEKVAEARARRAKAERERALDYAARKPWEPERVSTKPAKPFTAEEIDNMPGWLRAMGLRNGFLVERNGKLIDADVA